VAQERKQQQPPQLEHEADRRAAHDHVAEILKPVHHVQEEEQADGEAEDRKHFAVDVTVEDAEHAAQT
jgi:hypothetical protein